MKQLLAFAAAIFIALSPAGATSTTPYEFVSIYLRELGSLEDVRTQAEIDQKADPTDFANCIRNNEAIGLELDAAARSLDTIHLATGSAADVAPHYIANFYRQKRAILDQFTKICSIFIQGPKKGVDYGALSAKAPALTAQINFIDKTLFQTSILVFGTLISPKPDAQGHASHMVITREERDALLKTIENYFGRKIGVKDESWAVSTADVFRDKLKEFKCWDEPWN